MIVAKDIDKRTKQKTNNKLVKNLVEGVNLTAEEVIHDYRLAYQSRQASLLGRREVMSGKAKFGIFGDGKEVAQVVMARAFRKGDFRSGYYRDQTFMFALGMSSIQEFFAQLYAHADVEADPASAGRQMNNHFATRSLSPDGSWKNIAKMYNSSADVSPTGSQMPRLVGLAYASRLYRELDELHHFSEFSNKGNEIAFGTIGNATCAEGMFWEAINAIGVLGAPTLLSIWDDEYGISVANEHQIAKGNISTLLEGFRRENRGKKGFDLYKVKGWDYPGLVRTYLEAADKVRRKHVPAIIHVVEMTQPQGHSTSGSHERYKTKERLQWEDEFDCIRKLRQWIVEHKIKSDDEMDEIDKQDLELVKSIRDRAWEAYLNPIKRERDALVSVLSDLAGNSHHASQIEQIRSGLTGLRTPLRRDLMVALRRALIAARDDNGPARQALIDWKNEQLDLNEERYSSHLYSESEESALKIPEMKPVYSEKSRTVNGFDVLNACFDAALKRDPRVIAFGEDVGRLGGVNQGFKNLQAKYGELRVADTGIRECTIIGQAIGMAMRGLRPIAEIQYLDYILYALQILSDDLATLHWRSKGGQKAPVIVRTRGHRLEGVWHAGSHMAAMIHLLRGMHVIVPRNMTQAAGFYNTLLHSDEPGVVVEVLNGYRLKEKLPDNIGEFTVPLGVPEVLREGTDVTIVTYGACCRIALEAADALSDLGVEAEVVDIQTLLPFDLHGKILTSLKKTNRIVFVDEDMPGGAAGYMMQEVLEKQGGYRWLDSQPRTVPARPHRPAYGSDGDYFSKPNVEEVLFATYALMHEANPAKFPMFF